MKILFVMLSSIEDLSSATLRNLALIKGLVSLEHNCTVVCLDKYSGITTSDISKYDFLENVKIIKIERNDIREKICNDKTNRGLKSIVVNILRKMYHMFSIFDSSKKIAEGIKINILEGNNDYDMVISSSDPKTAHLAVNALISQGLTYKRWIEYWGDPLTSDITNKTIYPRFVYKRIEQSILDVADKIVYTSPFTLKEAQKMHESIKDRMVCVPTAYLNKRILPSQNGKFTIGYYGAYKSEVRNIQPLYDACKYLSEEVNLRIVGNSDLILAESSNIEVHPRGEIESFEETTDLFVCVLNKHGTQIPGKLYHYAAYNRPVLVIEDGDMLYEMDEYITSFGRYYTCKNNIDDIVYSINEIRKDNRQWMPLEELLPERVAERIIK